mmetsp:Transcript_13575/g.13506  ORF Transcript_13575/g.13506 Transcript_13575/m.13506 type:complete len:210 (+) Transcript_13575:468-1097(+)
MGTFIGAQVNEWLPDLVMSIFLFLLLLFITFQSIMKGISMMNKEDHLFLRQGELYQERARRVKESRKEAVRDARRSLSATAKASLLETNKENHTGINASIASSDRDSIALKMSHMEEIRVDRKEERKEGVVDFDDEDIPPLDLMEALGAEKADYTDDEINPTLEGIFYGEQNHITIDKGLLVAFPVLTITLITVFRGSKSLKSIIGVER